MMILRSLIFFFIPRSIKKNQSFKPQRVDAIGKKIEF